MASLVTFVTLSIRQVSALIGSEVFIQRGFKYGDFVNLSNV
jgi:hypothetical protein